MSEIDVQQEIDQVSVVGQQGLYADFVVQEQEEYSESEDDENSEEEVDLEIKALSPSMIAKNDYKVKEWLKFLSGDNE